VRRHHHDGVDVGPLEQPAEDTLGAGARLARGLDDADRTVHMTAVDVADSADADVRFLEEAVEAVHAHPSDADHAEHDLVAGRRCLAGKRRTMDGGGGETRGRPEEHAARDWRKAWRHARII